MDEKLLRRKGRNDRKKKGEKKKEELRNLRSPRISPFL